MKPFTTLAVFVLALVAVAHLLRLIFGWEVVFNGSHIPLWVSVIAVVLPSGLACMVWRESRN